MEAHTREEARKEPAALDELRDDPQSRKRFLKMVGGAGAAGALSLLIAACGGDDDDDESASTTSTTDSMQDGSSASKGDLEIVNYALTLEYLEADFYEQVIKRARSPTRRSPSSRSRSARTSRSTSRR